MAMLTSAEAAKLLKKLNDELNSLSDMEAISREFLAALGEDPESVRPAYDYAETNGRIDELEEKIRILKHSINHRYSSDKYDGRSGTRLYSPAYQTLQ